MLELIARPAIAIDAPLELAPGKAELLPTGLSIWVDQLVGKGTLPRRDFYQTFCWRDRKPREPKPSAPQRKPAKELARPAFSAKPKPLDRGGHAPRRKVPPAAEIYAVRRPIR